MGAIRAVLNRLAARARRRRPLLFVFLLGIALLWPLARRTADVTAAPEIALQDQAAASIRAVQQGERIYRAVHGYYDRLECVIQDSCATINPYPPTYLDSRLAWATRFGYRFRFHDGARATEGRDEWVSPTGLTGYAMTAIPLAGDAGLPSFCGDNTGVLYRHDAGRLPAVDAGRCLPSGGVLVGN
jgi:hypothetical protein